MTGIQKTIVYLNYLGLGLFAPVLSLFLLNHGCDIRTLSIVIAIYSATVIAAEVPSGMFADLRGRKKAYFMSAIFTFGGFMLMYIAHSLPVLIPGIILLGFGAAFLSGSLDSLIIEDCICRKGDAALSEVTGAILIYQCAGIASGALINAVLPNKNGYLLHILIRLFTLLLVVILCAFFLHEGTLQRHEHNSIREQTKIIISSLKGKQFLQIALFCVFGSSISIFALETYWQPQFSTFLTVRQDGMLGILCAVGYG